MLGARLKIARHAAGLSMRSLAEKIGISAAAVSKYESGQLTPDSSRLGELARTLGVRTEFFFRPDEIHLEQVEYRKKSSLPKKAQRAIEARIVEQAERFLEVLGLFPDPPISCFELPADIPTVDNLEAVEEVSEALRDAWELGVGPIADLTILLEEQGLMILFSTESDESFDGLACRVDSRPLVVLGANWPGDRQRFTLAHELGHLVLDDRTPSQVNLEAACNRFAGAFLVPAAALRGSLGASRRSRVEPKELYELKHDFGVSMQAILHRAWNLGILGNSEFRREMRIFAERGWRSKEPGVQLLPEPPRAFEQLVFHALAEKMIGESKAAELLSVSLDELHDLRSLEFPDADPGQRRQRPHRL